MSARIDQNRTQARYDVETAPADTAQQGTQQTAKPKPADLGAGPTSLVKQYEAGKRDERIASARATMGKLAAELPGHGVDLNALAQSFGGARYAGFSREKVAAAASFTFVQKALTQQPELADRAVAMRARGLPATDRAIVDLALARSGATGYAKYAECERVLRELSGFDAEQRKDISGLMRAGASFGGAVAEEKKTLARIDKEEAAHRTTPSMSGQRRASVQRASADAAQWKKVSSHMNTAIRSVPSLSRGAEVAVGVGAGAGTVGSVAWNGAKSAVTGDGSHVKRSIEEADRAGGYVAGELSSRIAQADQLYVEFSQQHAEYVGQTAKYQRAVQSGDHDGVTAAAARMKTLTRDMASTVKAFDAVAKRIGEMNAQFDAAAAHAAAHLALSAVSVGLHSPPIKSVGEAIKHGLKDATREAAILDGAHKLAH